MLNKFISIFSNDTDPTNAQNTQKKNLVIITIALITILFFLMMIFSGDNGKKKEDIGDFKIVNGNRMAKTKWVGEAAVDVRQSRREVEKVKYENKQLRKQLNEMKKMIIDIKQNIKENKQKTLQSSTTNNINKNILYKNFPKPPLENPGDYGVNKFGKVPQINKKIVVRNSILNDSLVYQSVAQPEKKSKKQNQKIEPLKILSTGTITKVTLLGGMDAPTMAAAKTNPLPVLMRVNDLSFLPNNWRYNMDGCFILGEGYGDLSSERAYIRTTTLSCVTKDGYHIDTPFKGAVYGEDGKVGLRGRVVTKQGAMLARTLIAGFLQGISEAFKQSNTILSVSPTGTTQAFDPNKAMQTGMFSGASKATEKLADFYLKMADQIAPIIEISAGRKVDVIATDRIELKPLETMTKKGKK